MVSEGAQKRSTAQAPSPLSISNQFSPPQPPPDHALRHVYHQIDGISFPVIVAAGKLADVPIKMLFAEVVEGTLIAALQHGPEALDPAGVRHPANVLTGGMIHRLMIEGHPLIGASIISEHLGAARHARQRSAEESACRLPALPSPP